MDDYSRYKLIRDLAWKTLIRGEASSLPVNIVDIAAKHGIKVVSYSKGASLIEECGFVENCILNDAFSIFTDKWYILIKDNDYEKGFESLDRTVFALAHELGHILLSHKMERKKVGFFTAYYTKYNRQTSSKDPIEHEANTFAERILAPACVLSSLNSFTKEQIMSLTKLPEKEAGLRSKRLTRLVDKGHFFQHSLENEVFNRFKLFIESYNAESST